VVNIVAGTCVVIAQEVHRHSHAEVVVEEAGKDGICLVVVNGALASPVSVVLDKPPEIILTEVYAGTQMM
jgi:hypothetical protein